MTADTKIATGNLPAEPNSFVGRERDLAELALLLGEVRALTLCGPGGIGKTRLALRLACEIVPGFPDGAWLVELGDTDDPGLVPLRVAAALGIREERDRPLTETLADALRPRRMVLILDLLAALIDKSLVTVDAELDGDSRYRLLDMIREYAAARLVASGEEAAVRARHRDYLLDLAESIVARAFLRGDPPWPERIVMYRRVHAERANFIAALALSAERGEAEVGLRLCGALRSPWVAYGDVTEGSGWFDRFLGLDDPVRPGVRARALMLRAELAFEQQDYVAAASCAQAGIDLCRSSGGTGEAGGHRMLALVSLRAGQQAQALSSAEAAVAAARAAGDDWEEGLAQSTRGAVLARQGKFDDAQAAYEAALEVLRDNNGWGVAQTLHR